MGRKKLDLIIVVDYETIGEIEKKISDSLRAIPVEKPNVAKVAGITTFWIRKLKPLSYPEKASKKLLLINEAVSLWVGLSICRKYFDDRSAIKIFLDPRIQDDWITSLRYNSHSPHSSLISFELLNQSPPEDKAE